MGRFRERAPIHQLHRRTWLPTPRQEAFAFFCDPINLQRITPPELDFTISELPEGEMRAGAEIGYRLRLWGVPFAWRTRIVDWRAGHEFVDTALLSPYAFWHHRHVLLSERGGTTMIDLVDYALPLWPLGEIFHPVVRRQLERIFDYRESAVRDFFGEAASAPLARVSNARTAA